MRPVQRRREVSKGVLGGCVTWEELTASLCNNSFQGLQDALLLNPGILMDTQDTFMEDVWFF